MEEKNKIGLFGVTMLTTGCMMGAGALVVPGEIIPNGFAGIVGWIVSSLCSLCLAILFARNAVSQEQEESIGVSVQREYGDVIGLRVRLNQIIFMLGAIALVGSTFLAYFKELTNINSHYSDNMIFLSVLTIFAWLISSKREMAIISTITVVKLTFFFVISMIGIFTFDSAKFFNINLSDFNKGPNVPDFVHKVSNITYWPVFLATLIIFVSGYLARYKARHRKTFYMGIFLPITVLLLLFLFIKPTILGLSNSGNTAFEVLNKILRSANVALFAFTGLESATTSIKSINNPKVTVPRATILSMFICSFVFILTHVCALNNLKPDDSLQTPIKTGVCNFVFNRSLSHNLSKYKASQKAKIIEEINNGQTSELSSSIFSKSAWTANICGKLISLFAVIGCMGTILGLLKGSSALIVDILGSGKNIENAASLLSVLVAMVFFMLMKYIKNEIVGIVMFYIVNTYFYGVLASVKRRSVSLFIGGVSMFSCFLLLMGCRPECVLLGFIINIFVESMYAILRPNKALEKIQENKFLSKI